VDLAQLTATGPLPRTTPRVGPPAPALQLLRWYREAQRRFGIRWQLLAAVNFVESAFGKVRNTSGAGARGPMHSSRPRGAPTASAATSPTHTTRSSVPPTTSPPTAASTRTRRPLSIQPLAALRRRSDALRKPDRTRSPRFLPLLQLQVYFRTRAGYRRVTGPR